MIKAIIFDMDGVIFDSEGLYRDACIDLVERYGGTVTEELFEKQMGLKMEESQRVAVEVSKANVSPEEFGRQYEREFLRRARYDLKTIHGFEELLEYLSKKVRMAVASSTRTDIVERFLEMFGFHSYFEVILGGDRVTESKPAPEIYLKAAQMLHLNNEECLVIEDSPAGIRSAVSAGMRVIAVRHNHNNRLDLSLAEREFNSHIEVKAYLGGVVLPGGLGYD